MTHTLYVITEIQNDPRKEVKNNRKTDGEERGIDKKKAKFGNGYA